MLPPSCRWADAADGGACLYRNYGCIASIQPDGTTKFKYWQKEFHFKAASVAQAKRFIERWINARNSPRAHECAHWRNRHFRAAQRAPSQKRTTETQHLNVLNAQSGSGGSSSWIVKMNVLPDEFDAISDVGQPLHVFTQSPGLNVTAASSHAWLA